MNILETLIRALVFGALMFVLGAVGSFGLLFAFALADPDPSAGGVYVAVAMIVSPICGLFAAIAGVASVVLQELRNQ